MIDYGQREALRIGFGHQLVDARIDRRAIGQCRGWSRLTLDSSGRDQRQSRDRENIAYEAAPS
jgi:hypothetical protein